MDEYRKLESEKEQARRNCQEFKHKEIEIQNQSKRKTRSNTCLNKKESQNNNGDLKNETRKLNQSLIVNENPPNFKIQFNLLRS